jgi:hypothetical protein
MEVILITMQEKNQTHKCPDSRNWMYHLWK